MLDRLAARKDVYFYLILLGLFLTIRGYRSREVDQAYRLPILLHQHDARVYANDPFVASFAQFNPHRGYLALLDGLSRPFGLSAALAIVFLLTFLITVSGLNRLGSDVWPDRTGSGRVAASLGLIALAGNIGTNHLFEPMLLDRLIAFGFGWQAIAYALNAGRGREVSSAVCVGLATLIHPSVGLQIAMLIGAGWFCWSLLDASGEIRFNRVGRAWIALGLAIVPGALLNLKNSGLLLSGLSPDEMRLLTAELQSPQHMLPHLWRSSQWLAWGCYPALAFCALAPVYRIGTPRPPGRQRLIILIILNLAGLVLAWYAIEGLENLRVTLFQPFRMATVARGLCLVLIAGHVKRLWAGENALDRLRSVLIPLGLVGDWMLVVVTAFEVTLSVSEALSTTPKPAVGVVGLGVLALGLVFLGRHDTESGHWPLLAAIVAVPILGQRFDRRPAASNSRRLAFRLAACWVVPVLALVANAIPAIGNRTGEAIRETLVRRCRFAEVPVDDLERLAVWAREHTALEARFIGPPGPKTFRLWSRRNLAFNRSASPYAASGLADWSERFRDHVGFAGTNAELVRAYQRDRHGLERRYDALSADDLAGLAGRQGATFVLALANKNRETNGRSLVPVHVEGRYAVYRLNQPEQVVASRRGP